MSIYERHTPEKTVFYQSLARSWPGIVRDYNAVDEKIPRKAVGKAKAEQKGWRLAYLWKPSPLFVAGLTLGIAIATATAVAKIRIKQFWAIPLAGKVVAGPCMMAMPPCVFNRDVGPRSRTHGAAGRIASGGDRYRHEDVPRMVGDLGRLVAQRQECRDWHVPAEPVAKELRCEQELGEGASEGEVERTTFKPNPVAVLSLAVL